MLVRLKRRGYSFISLDEALQDKAYQLKDEYVGPLGISWVHRWSIVLAWRTSMLNQTAKIHS